MPSYHWLADKKTDFKSLPKKIDVLKQLGVPYVYDRPEDQHVILDQARVQALEIAKGLFDSGVTLPEDLEQELADEMKALQKANKAGDKDAVALVENKIKEKLSERRNISVIAYLQKLGAYDVVKEEDRKKAPALINPDTKHPNTAPNSAPTK